MLTIVTWLWGSKYPIDYVRRLVAGLQLHLVQPYRIVLISDQLQTGGADEVWPIPDPDLLEYPGCIARLRMFDPAWQMSHGILPGRRLVCIDLDVVVTGHLDPLFDRPESFLILQGANAFNPCPYNGSVFMLRGGEHADVWSDFTFDALGAIPQQAFPDDQGWLAHKAPGAAGWHVGSESGIWAFRKPQWPRDDALPKDARLVVFPGWRDPSKFQHLDWVEGHWR